MNDFKNMRIEGIRDVMCYNDKHLGLILGAKWKPPRAATNSRG
jgi:hypothetical protein